MPVQPPAKGGRMSTLEPGPIHGPSSCGLSDTPSTRKLHTGVTVVREGNSTCRPSMTSSNVPGGTAA